MEETSSKRFGIVVLAVTLAFVLNSIVSGQDEIIPADNSDLETLISKANFARGLAQRCAGDDCVPVRCSTAQALNNELIEARYYARYNYYWLREASESHRAAYLSQAGSIIRDAERRRRILAIAAYQEYFTTVAGTVLRTTAVLSTARGLAQNPERIRELSNLQKLALIDDIYEGLKALESATNTVVEARAAAELPRLFRTSSDELDQYKSQISRIRRAVTEAVRNGRDVTSTLSSPQVWNNVGQIAGTLLINYSNEEIAERRRIANALDEEVAEGERPLIRIHRDWLRYRARRDLAEDAYNNINSLFTDSEASWTSCIGKLSVYCNSFRRTPRSTVPAAAEVRFFGEDLDLARHAPGQTYGQALTSIRGRFEEIIGRMNEIEIEEVTPEVRTQRSTFRPGEPFTASFTAPACYPRDSRLGLYETTADRTISSAAISFHSLNRAETGERRFVAPEEPGLYFLNIYDTGRQREAARVVIRVEERSEGEKSVESGSGEKGTAPAVRALADTWRLTLYGNEVAPIAVEIDGSKGRWSWLVKEKTGSGEEIWVPNKWVASTFEGGELRTTWSSVCVFEPGVRSHERNDIPARIGLSSDGTSLEIRLQNFVCEDPSLVLKPGWKLTYTGRRFSKPVEARKP